VGSEISIQFKKFDSATAVKAMAFVR
jgi:hypothetical protein